MTLHRSLSGEGTAEALWQRWLTKTPLAIALTDDVLPAKARLVIVAPHPDDEVLACGGLVASHAADGGSTMVIAVTDGEASHASASRERDANLARLRRAECAEGLRRLTMRDLPLLQLGLPDGKVARHADTLQRRLASVLHRDDVVVTTWRLDGHPDHEATGSSVAQACWVAGCKLLEAPVWMWHWAAPADARVPWQRMVGIDLGAPALQRKQSALAAHSTQLQRRDADTGPVLGTSILARAARTTEYFFT
jgi:LmbE family N-acetylglucosaminyl deacetylase